MGAAGEAETAWGKEACIVSPAPRIPRVSRPRPPGQGTAPDRVRDLRLVRVLKPGEFGQPLSLALKRYVFAPIVSSAAWHPAACQQAHLDEPLERLLGLYGDESTGWRRRVVREMAAVLDNYTNRLQTSLRKSSVVRDIRSVESYLSSQLSVSLLQCCTPGNEQVARGCKAFLRRWRQPRALIPSALGLD